MIAIQETVSTLTISELGRLAHAPPVHYLYPAEGFGNVYRRVITNDFFTDLIRRTNIRKVAEAPLDSYGIVGAGSLIFPQLACETTLISDERNLLERARALMDFNGVSDIRYLHSPLTRITVADDTFDFTWNFDRLQATSDPAAVLRELCRISKAVMVCIPNAHTYGQYPHYVYHRVTGTTCDYVGPRKWMLRSTLRDAMRRNGMAIVTDGVIDAPWWPGFPELPDLVRKLLGRQPVSLDDQETPEANPEVVSPSQLAELHRRVERSAFIERGPWPAFVKVLFAHNAYVIGCKPQYRRELGL